MRKRRVWMAINNFARSPLFTRERWRNRFPLVMGKQTEKTNRFRREEDWTQNQICTTRVSRRIGVVGLFDIHCTGKFLEGARLQILPFYLFWDDVLLCTSRQSEYTDMASRGGGGDRQETNIHCQYFLHIFPLSTSSTFGSWPVSSFLSPRDFSPFPISSLVLTFPTVQKSSPLPIFFCCLLVLDHFI